MNATSDTRVLASEMVTKALRGKQSKGLRLGHGSILLLDFEPVSSEPGSYLRVECAWRVDGPDGPLAASEDDRASIKRVLDELGSVTVQSAQVDVPSFELQLLLDRGHRLGVFPIYAQDHECENWTVHAPDGQVIVAGPGKTVRITRGDAA